MIPAKKTACASSPQGKLTANEYRELMVAVGAKVWYELTSEETVAKSWVSAGLSSSLDGSENDHAKAQMPGSGRRVVPPYGMEAGQSKPAQAGFGVVVTGVGGEVVPRPECASVSRVEANRSPAQLQLQAPEAGDAKLVFRTEVEEKQEESRLKSQQPRKKAKIVSEEDADESGGEADSAEAESQDSSSGEDSEEEHTPFDQAEFLAEVKSRLGIEMCLEFTAPRELDIKLVEHYIAFHHGDGWDVGLVTRQVDPNKHPTQLYNYDVSYPARGGTMFHRLQLELYGVGTEEGAPLGSWVLLAPLEPVANPPKRKRTGRR